MLRYEHTTYYTLSEVVAFLDDPTAYPPDGSQYWSPTLSSLLEAFLNDAVSSYSATLSFYDGVNSAIRSEAVELLDALQNKWNDQIAAIARTYYQGFEGYDVIEETDAWSVACLSFIKGLVSVLNLTYPRYSVILSAYATQKTKLLDQVKLESKALTRHNDAPQNSGDYSGDTYTSDYVITSAEQETDHGTPMERLREIEQSYSDVLKDWLKYFDQLFMLEANL